MKLLVRQFVIPQVSPVVLFINVPYLASTSLQWVLKVIVPHLPEYCCSIGTIITLRLPSVHLGFLRFRYRPPIPVPSTENFAFPVQDFPGDSVETRTVNAGTIFFSGAPNTGFI